MLVQHHSAASFDCWPLSTYVLTGFISPSDGDFMILDLPLSPCSVFSSVSDVVWSVTDPFHLPTSEVHFVGAAPVLLGVLRSCRIGWLCHPWMCFAPSSLVRMGDSP